jgi:hypothetical protein
MTLKLTTFKLNAAKGMLESVKTTSLPFGTESQAMDFLKRYCYVLKDGGGYQKSFSTQYGVYNQQIEVIK